MVSKQALKPEQVWSSLVAHVSRGEEAEKFLVEVFHEVGSYGGTKLSGETASKLQRFFGYDDSE